MSQKAGATATTARLIVLMGVVVASFSGILVKAIHGLTPTGIALGRCSLATLVLFAMTVCLPGPDIRKRRHGWQRCALYTSLAGVVFGLNLHIWSVRRPKSHCKIPFTRAATNEQTDQRTHARAHAHTRRHRSVVLVGAGLATLFTNTQVFWVTIASSCLCGERLTARFCLAGAGEYRTVVSVAIKRDDAIRRSGRPRTSHNPPDTFNLCSALTTSPHPNHVVDQEQSSVF